MACKPKIEILQISEDGLKVQCSKVTLDFMIKLRQALFTIPALGISHVNILKDTSFTKDPVYTKRRIELTPLLSTDALKFARIDSCVCGGVLCNACSVIFDIDVRNTTSLPLNVTSEHLVLRVRDDDDFGNSSNYHLSVKPVQMQVGDCIEYVELLPGQSFCATVHATIGTHEEDPRWAVMCAPSLRLLPKIEINHAALASLTEERRKEFVNTCPKNVFEIEDISNNVKVARPENCTTCWGCLEFRGNGKHHKRATPHVDDGKLTNSTNSDASPYVRLTSHPGVYLFSFENRRLLSCQDILKQALKLAFSRLN